MAPLTEDPHSASGSVSLVNWDLEDENRRWIVVSEVLQMVLQPTLVSVIEPAMKDHYVNLDLQHHLRSQTEENYLHSDGKFKFNYDSINGNSHKDKSKWNYALRDENDLAKLYMKSFMAKFSKIGDGSFDLSASLNVLGSCSAFSHDIKRAADTVRTEVRNPWAHADFKDWTERKFVDSLSQIKKLVENLNMEPYETRLVVDKIDEWEKKGYTLCLEENVDSKTIETLSTTLKTMSMNTKDPNNPSQSKDIELEKKLGVVRSSLHKQFSHLIGDVAEVPIVKAGGAATTLVEVGTQVATTTVEVGKRVANTAIEGATKITTTALEAVGDVTANVIQSGKKIGSSAFGIGVNVFKAFRPNNTIKESEKE